MSARRASPSENLRPPPQRRGRVQFRLLHLLVLTTVVALILGLTISALEVLALPALILYMLVLGVFLLLRGGRTKSELHQVWEDFKTLSENDDDLAREALLLRRKLEETKAAQQGEARRESEGPADPGAEGTSPDHRSDGTG